MEQYQITEPAEGELSLGEQKFLFQPKDSFWVLD